MKYLITTLIIFHQLIHFSFCQNQKFFSEKGTDFGVYYYPEHWAEDQWERDLKRIASLGFEFVHYAEFAWADLEPTEGNYQFEWLDRVVELAAQNNLKVIMCTPSPCVPAWLSTKHPEVLAMNESGMRLHHNGSRLTASLANPIYQQYVEKIATKMAERYGKDKRIWGWQIGNEPHIQSVYDYSPSAEKEFQKWLKNKYQNIDALNQAWGAAFWSYKFNNFDQIKIPNPSQTGTNPHAQLDFQAYTAYEIANDLNTQSRTLRKFTSPEQWITTNYAYFKFLPHVNPFLTKDDLDFSSHTMYLTSNWLNTSNDALAHRLGSGLELSFSQEMGESTNGYTGIMELQPGQINWGKINAMPNPGAVRMWVWHAFALGDEFVCSYRYRQPLFGSEQFHHGIMMTDGITVNRGGQEFLKAMEEIREINGDLKKEENTYIENTRTAFLWSNQNIMDLENYKHHEGWDSWQHIYTYYQALKRMGVAVDFVQESDNLNPETHPFLVVPAYQMMSLEVIEKLKKYADDGGHLVISTRTALKNEQGHLWEMKIQEPIWDLIGGQIEFYDHLPKAHAGNVSFDNKSYPWNVWGEVVSPQENTEVWGTYADQFYKDKAAITHKKYEKGSVTYIGAWSNNWEMEFEALHKLYSEKSNEAVHKLPPYVFAEFREGVWVAVNYTDKNVEISLGKSSKILVGETNTLAPAGVLVWKE